LIYNLLAFSGIA